MASFVTVVDSSARRVKVKTTPEKSLSEVLQEACTSWRYNASLYSLKYVSFVRYNFGIFEAGAHIVIETITKP